MVDEDVGEDDKEEEEDTVEEPEVDHLDVVGDGEGVRGVVEEGVQDQECGQTHHQAYLLKI